MTNPILQLPLTWLFLALAAVAVCLGLALASLRRMARSMEGQATPGLPLLGRDQPGSSPLHTWDPRCKIFAFLTFALLAVSLKQPISVAAALSLAAATVFLGRLPWAGPLRRILAMNGFLAMFLIVMPLTAVVQPGDTLLVFGGFDHWPVNLRGLELALVLVGKAWTVALLMEPLLGTAPLGATLDGLTRLGLPARVTELLLLTHRYLHVFFEELQRMRSGMDARGFRPGHGLANLRDYGNFIGMLLVRSYERTHRVYDAMQARGYTGRMPGQTEFTTRPADILKILVMVGSGLGLLISDRLLGGGF